MLKIVIFKDTFTENILNIHPLKRRPTPRLLLGGFSSFPSLLPVSSSGPGSPSSPDNMNRLRRRLKRRPGLLAVGAPFHTPPSLLLSSGYSLPRLLLLTSCFLRDSRVFVGAPIDQRPINQFVLINLADFEISPTKAGRFLSSHSENRRRLLSLR